MITLFIAGNVFGSQTQFDFLRCEGSDFKIGRGILTMAYGMYFLFGQKFTEVKKLRPKFNEQLKYAYTILLTIGLLDVLYMTFGGDYLKSDHITRWVHFSLMIYSIYVIIYLITLRNILTTILVIGSSLLVVGACIGLIDMMFISKRHLSPNEYFIFIELGIIGEFLCLTYGLIYKTRLIQEENLRLIQDENQKVLKERERIYQDLHDDLGAGISSVKILSELMTDGRIPEEKMKAFSSKLHHNIEEISHQLQNFIWTLDESHSGIQEFLEYIKRYIDQYLTSERIEVSVQSTIRNEKMRLDALIRKNLFLCIKEILNNALKHSEASHICISIINHTNSNLLKIKISDNGKGIQDSSIKGNGLRNIAKRLEEIGAKYQINTGIHGTEFALTLDC